MSGDSALCINHCDLPNVSAFITCEERFERIGRALSGPHEVEAKLAIARVDKRLGRNRADPSFGPAYDRAY